VANATCEVITLRAVMRAAAVRAGETATSSYGSIDRAGRSRERAADEILADA